MWAIIQDLVIHVDDTNDVAPKFMASTVESSVEEGDPPGRFLAKLEAFDEVPFPHALWRTT